MNVNAAACVVACLLAYSLILKMKAVYSFKVQQTSARLHGVTSQEIILLIVVDELSL
jgi:hypothetical protein